MRRIVKTEALCLRAQNWRESSKIVTLLTPDLGLLAGIARGARRPKNRFGGAALNLFARSRLTIYLRENRELCTIGDAELINAHPGIALEYHRYLTAGEIVKFVLTALAHRNPEYRVFELLKKTLATLSSTKTASTDYSALRGAFLLKACSFLGFRPQLQLCVLCHYPIPQDIPLSSTGIGFDIRKGGVVCSLCPAPTKKPLSPEEVQILKTLLHTPGSQLLNQEVPSHLLKLITDYAEFHLEIKRH